MGNSSSKQTQTSSSHPPSKDRRGEVIPEAFSALPQDRSVVRPRVSEPAVTTAEKETLSPRQQAIDTKRKELNYVAQIEDTRESIEKNLKEFNENTKGLLDFRDELMGMGILPSELQASLNPLEAACRVAQEINKELKIFSDIANDLFDRHAKVKFRSLQKKELQSEENKMALLKKQLSSCQGKLTQKLQKCKEHVQTFENCFERTDGSLDRIKEGLQSDRKKSIAKGCLAAAGLLLGGVLIVGAIIFVAKQGDMALMKSAPAAVASEPKRWGNFLISSISNSIGDYREANAQLESIERYQELLKQPNSLNFETENVSEMIKMVLTDANTCCDQVLESIQREEQRIQLIQEKEQWIQEREQLKAENARLKQENEQTVQTQQQPEEQTGPTQHVESSNKDMRSQLV